MAKADKVRYNREMSDYVPPKGFGKRGRKRKDPNAPKRPPSAFFVFCSEYRPSVKQQYPGLSIGDCAKKLGEMWSKLTQSEKQPYEEKAQKLREKYDRVRPQNGSRTFLLRSETLMWYSLPNRTWWRTAAAAPSPGTQTLRLRGARRKMKRGKTTMKRRKTTSRETESLRG
ncbi:hypothetical protein XENORESO_019610 [Xenotaenia resolanae]|uniref:HMG box domain-containing protein n=1 Tax=Xenotaenia resolanae TaxID=208358 RepID=A0ABV0VMG1_9TELE